MTIACTECNGPGCAWCGWEGVEPATRDRWTVWCGADLLHAHDGPRDAVEAARYEAATHGGEIVVRRPGGAVVRRVERYDASPTDGQGAHAATAARLLFADDIEF